MLLSPKFVCSRYLGCDDRSLTSFPLPWRCRGEYLVRTTARPQEVRRLSIAKSTCRMHLFESEFYIHAILKAAQVFSICSKEGTYVSVTKTCNDGKTNNLF